MYKRMIFEWADAVKKPRSPRYSISKPLVTLTSIALLYSGAVVSETPDQNGYVISAGLRGACVVDDSGPTCWGQGDASKDTLLNSTLSTLANPTLVSDSRYGETTCAIDDNGAHCWKIVTNSSTGHSISDVTAETLPVGINAPSDIDLGWGLACVQQLDSVSCRSSWEPSEYDASSEPGGLINVRQISAGGAGHACAIDDNGLHCWGGSTNQANIPASVDPTQVTQVATGAWHTCVLDNSAQGVTCWALADNDYYRSITNIPAEVVNPRQISAGVGGTCVLDDSPKGVTCWGPPSYTATLVQVPGGLINPRRIDVGNGQACVLDGSAKGVTCWGGYESPEAITPPDGLSFSQNAGEQLLADSDQYGYTVSGGNRGGQGACAIDDNGVRCWNLFFLNWMTDAQLEVLNARLAKFVNPRRVTIRSSSDTICVQDDNGYQCVRPNYDNLLGEPVDVDPMVPTIPNPKYLAIGYFGLRCALDANDKVNCVTDEYPDETYYDPTTEPTGLSNVRQLVAASMHACALDDNGLHCWGSSAPYAKVPPEVNPLEVRQVGVGWLHTCVLDNSAKGVTCWSEDVHDGYLPLVQVPDEVVNPRQLAVGTMNSCVLDDSPKGVTCWGLSAALPSVPELINPRYLTLNGSVACVLDDSEKGITCWGNPDSQQLVPEDFSFARHISQPYLESVTPLAWDLGTTAELNLTGINFVNQHISDDLTTGEPVETTLMPSVRLTDSSGNATVLEPSISEAGFISVTVPHEVTDGTNTTSLIEGDYQLQVEKGGKLSNPVVVTIIPKIDIRVAACFPEYNAVLIRGFGLGTIDSWDDYETHRILGDGAPADRIFRWQNGMIAAKFFAGCPNTVEVSHEYDSATAPIYIAE